MSEAYGNLSDRVMGLGGKKGEEWGNGEESKEGEGGEEMEKGEKGEE